MVEREIDEGPDYFRIAMDEMNLSSDETEKIDKYTLSMLHAAIAFVMVPSNKDKTLTWEYMQEYANSQVPDGWPLMEKVLAKANKLEKGNTDSTIMSLMEMDRQRFVKMPEETTECLKKSGVENVNFINNFSDILFDKPIIRFLPVIIGELTDNCRDKGAKNISITINDNSLMVEDDVVEAEPEKTLDFLNNIVRFSKGITTKDAQRTANGCGPEGGMGISVMVMGFLKKYGGNLEYSVNEGKIVAKAEWP